LEQGHLGLSFGIIRFELKGGPERAAGGGVISHNFLGGAQIVKMVGVSRFQLSGGPEYGQSFNVFALVVVSDTKLIVGVNKI
jgi:hypothetical protein